MPGTTTLAEPVIETHRMTLRFGHKIVGGSGSGKTSLLREMAMLQSPSAGSVRVLGTEIIQRNMAQTLELRRRLGVLFQNGALFGGMNLSAGLIDEIACVKLALVGLTPDDGLLYPDQLSGGMHKRAALARAIALDPELLFLDEPTSGLDPLSAAAFDDLILELKSALNPTIVLVTHDMDSLWRVADRVILLGEARVLAEGTMQEMAQSRDPAVVRFFQNPRAHAAQVSA